MLDVHWRLHLALVVLTTTGCASAELVGTWDGTTVDVAGTNVKGVVDLISGGTATYTLEGSGVCNGSLVYSGYHWVADATTITFSGTPTCSGTVKCGALSVACGQSTLPTELGACTYALSNANDTLVTTACTNGYFDLTWTRE